MNFIRNYFYKKRLINDIKTNNVVSLEYTDLKGANLNDFPQWVIQGIDEDGYYNQTLLLEAIRNGFKNLESARLQGVNLKGVKLEKANLEEANLEGADLSKAFLIKANLHNANLARANLEGTVFEDVDLEESNLRNAKFLYTQYNKANFKNYVVTCSECHGDGGRFVSPCESNGGAGGPGECYHIGYCPYDDIFENCSKCKGKGYSIK